MKELSQAKYGEALRRKHNIDVLLPGCLMPLSREIYEAPKRHKNGGLLPSRSKEEQQKVKALKFYYRKD